MKKFLVGPPFKEWMEKRPDITLHGLAWALFWRGVVLFYFWMFVVMIGVLFVVWIFEEVI